MVGTEVGGGEEEGIVIRKEAVAEAGKMRRKIKGSRR